MTKKERDKIDRIIKAAKQIETILLRFKPQSRQMILNVSRILYGQFTQKEMSD